MKVFVTGISGLLGGAAARALLEAGHTVSGCDRWPFHDAPFPVRRVDLVTDPFAAEEVAGFDAVIHFANQPDADGLLPGTTLARNLEINRKVFTAVEEAGVRTLLFASSIQAFSGAPGRDRTLPPGAYLPLDGDLPAAAHDQDYGRSKWLAEEEMRAMAGRHPARGFVAIRFPWVTTGEDDELLLSRRSAPGARCQGFAFLPVEEVGPLLLAILRAELRGYRAYLPAARENLFFLPAAKVIRREFREVPLRRPLSEIEAIVDTSAITRDTGWAPGTPPFLRGARGSARRLYLAAGEGVQRRGSHAMMRVERAVHRLARKVALPPRLGRAAPVAGPRSLLGESPLWHPEERRLYRVDVNGRLLLRWDPESEVHEAMELPGAPGALFLREDGALLTAMSGTIFPVDFEGRRILDPIVPPFVGVPNRLNDGACDPRGRIWIGSMTLRSGRRTGALFCVHPDGRVERKVDRILCSNGICWSRDGRTLFYIDSGERRVDAFTFDPDRGELGERRTLLKNPGWLGLPDGMCRDREGRLWVALFGGGGVLCVDPERGKAIGFVEVPAGKVTSCTFGGEDSGTLYITTARVGLSDRSLAREPDAGALFAFRPDHPGEPVRRFSCLP